MADGSPYDEFQVTMMPNDGEIEYPKNRKEKWCKISKLMPGTEYLFTVITVRYVETAKERNAESEGQVEKGKADMKDKGKKTNINRQENFEKKQRKEKSKPSEVRICTSEYHCLFYYVYIQFIDISKQQIDVINT